MSDNYLNKLKQLERKHGRHFANLAQAVEFDRSNVSIDEIMKNRTKIVEINGRFTCPHCENEWSAMLGDNEVPEYCDCI